MPVMPTGAAGSSANPTMPSGAPMMPTPSQPGAAPAGECPPGFESTEPLVLTGATVPGNLELGLASAPETPRNPCGSAEEQACFTGINAARQAEGLMPFLWDGDLADLARSHAADRNQQDYPGSMHGSSTTEEHRYQERAEFLGMKSGKFRSVVENAGSGIRNAQVAVEGWLNSPGHRAVILGEGAWSGLRYAACGADRDDWNIEFGQ